MPSGRRSRSARPSGPRRSSRHPGATARRSLETVSPRLPRSAVPSPDPGAPGDRRRGCWDAFDPFPLRARATCLSRPASAHHAAPCAHLRRRLGRLFLDIVQFLETRPDRLPFRVFICMAFPPFRPGGYQSAVRPPPIRSAHAPRLCSGTIPTMVPVSVQASWIGVAVGGWQRIALTWKLPGVRTGQGDWGWAAD